MDPITERCRSLLVLGGGNAEAVAGVWTTKSAIARYLHDLADEIGSVTWMAQQSGTWGMRLEGEKEPDRLEGELDETRVRVVPFDYRMRRAPALCQELMREIPNHKYGLFFLPAAVPFAPVIRAAARKLDVSASYLAGDYIDAAHTMATGRWPGWSQLQRLAHIRVIRATDFAIARGAKLAAAAGRYSRVVHRTIPLANIALADSAEAATPVPGRLLFVGIVAESKGVGILIESVRQLISEGKDVSLTVCGDGPDLARYRDDVRAAGLDEAIHLLGWIDRPEDLDAAFQDASALVMPSSTHPEGVPRVIDEAIARGLPVVATTAGGVAEEFTAGEVALAPPGDLHALTDAIRRVLFDAEIREQIVAQAAPRREWLNSSGTAGVQHARLLIAADAKTP